MSSGRYSVRCRAAINGTGCACWRGLQAAGWRQPDLLAAALLHDLGKAQGRLSLIHRTFIIAARALGTSWVARLALSEPRSWRYPFYVHLHHAALGAARLQQAGASAALVSLVAAHEQSEATLAARARGHGARFDRCRRRLLGKEGVMQITLIGLDTLGLSLGLALKAVAPEIQLVGHDRERGRIKAASQAGAIDKGHWNLLSACDGSGLVVVNEPLAQIETELTALAPELSAEVVVLMLASVQRPLQALLARLQPRATFIGGRFVARHLSPDAKPDAALLKDALLYIIAPPAAPAEAIQTAVSLGEAVGARVCFADAAEHDGLAAPTEQLPRLLALALLSALASSEAQRELQRALDPALGALADHAPAPEELAELLANRDNLTRWLASYSARLAELTHWLTENDTARLEAEATAAQAALARWGEPEESDVAQPEATHGWRQMLLGQWRPKRRV